MVQQIPPPQKIARPYIGQKPGARIIMDTVSPPRRTPSKKVKKTTADDLFESDEEDAMILSDDEESSGVDDPEVKGTPKRLHIFSNPKRRGSKPKRAKLLVCGHCP